LGSRALREGSIGNPFLSSRAPVISACALLLLFVEEAEAVAVAEAGTGALRIRPGVHTGTLGAHFDITLKITINN